MMGYKELLSAKGWIGKGCPTCGGRSKIVYKNNSRPNEVIEILGRGTLFRYKKNGKRVSGGSTNSLKHQHFLQ